LAGGEIHPINRFDFKDPEALLQFLSEKEITVLNTVPSVLNSICEYLDQLSPETKIPFPEKLRLLLIGGEILPARLVERWKKHFGNAQRIVNLYGSTETLVNATFHEVKNDFGYLEGIPVGRPRKGVHVLLLHENGNPTKQGEKGELFVGGPGIAKGYFKDEHLTNESFVVPGIEGSNGIYYRTGDLAKKDGNGEFHFFGRNDNQIQLYGNRIEPAEIEAVLTSFHLINQAAVLDFKDENRHWLNAFVVLNGTKQNNAETEIRNYVAQKLPSYMVPQKIEFLNEIPLTQAGKIDRLGLRNSHKKETHEDRFRIIPTNTQLIIKGIWERVLKTEISDLNYDFFSLGGDSILALEVLHHLRKEFQYTPKPIELFRKKTIPELAESIDQINGNQGIQLDESKTEFPGSSMKEQTQFPLSVTQKGFFILNKLNPESSPNLVATIPVKGKIDRQSFQKALNFLVERHPMLRTRFIKNGLNTIQEIASFSEVEIEHRDLTQTTDSDMRISQLFEQYKKLKFDLSRPPLYKIASFQVSENSSVILFCIHHIIGDAWSMKVLTDELLEVYDQVTESKKLSLPELESSFQNLIYKESEKNNLSASQIAKTYNFWKESFQDLPKYEIPKHWIQAKESEEKVTLVLPSVEKEILKGFCSENGISLFQLLFTVFGRSLQKILNVNRLLINTSVSGRDLSIAGIERIIGCFARSLPVNLEFTDADVLSNVNELEHSFLNSSENHEILPNELIKIYMESGAESMQSLYRFFVSYMDFSALKSYKSHNLEFQWDDADFFFNAGSVESELFIGIRISDVILINFNGKTNPVFKSEVKKGMQDDLNALLKTGSYFETKPSFSSDKNLIDSALIAYFPSLGSMSELLPLGKFSVKLAKEFLNKILPNNEPQLLEIETTPFGRTGVVFIPCFADELLTLPQSRLMENILKAVNVCQQNGARYISLAGNLPSKTNYGFAVIDALKNTAKINMPAVLTTGHSCTVVAVVKTIGKVLKELDLEIKNLSVAVAGFGSIGQASINLLLAEIGSPAKIIIADLATQLPGLQKPLVDLKERFKNGVEVIPVDKTVTDDFYTADIIIGASSGGKVLDVSKIRPGTILVDDSFPHIFDVKKAISRMKKEQDVLIVGAGKLSVGEKERSILQKSVSESWIKKIIEKFGDEGLPGCQAESLLMSFDNSLPATIGLVTGLNAAQYWRKANELNLGAVGFHLQGYAVDNTLIQKVKTLHKKRYGQIG
jgi:non-ribosomal peptide synthetase component F